MKKKIWLVLTLFCLFTLPLLAYSPYDSLWKITVTDCQGNITIYEHCRILNQGPVSVDFMPDQNIVSAPYGKAKSIFINSCTTITQEEE